MMSLRQQIEADVPSATVNYAYGFPYVGDDESHFAKALDAIRQSDVAIITVGGKYGTGSSASQGEGIDATDINLPKCQEDFIKAAAHLNKPLIIVHFGGRPISSDAADTYAEAILEAWNPAECGSEAISSVIFGDSEPTGRMPATTAYTAGQLPLYYNHPNGSSYHQATGGAFDGYVDCPHERGTSLVRAWPTQRLITVSLKRRQIRLEQSMFRALSPIPATARARKLFNCMAAIATLQWCGQTLSFSVLSECSLRHRRRRRWHSPCNRVSSPT
ncbi:glycoside hydrolase family 3 protein [Lacticaseibacillus camelliae]|uniref:glycoside hydrolase family 3 protein n=1 Tax=Lacticaseibacillus camelliae TaxID=381742 RepID=UPI000A9C6B79|nr:glycoside hydrolase family 3 C-terminal domain-containing protein [Lacticaseibacillus camelliae]